MKTCPKCNKTSGDDWAQCGEYCPVRNLFVRRDNAGDWAVWRPHAAGGYDKVAGQMDTKAEAVEHMKEVP